MEGMSGMPAHRSLVSNDTSHEPVPLYLEMPEHFTLMVLTALVLSLSAIIGTLGNFLVRNYRNNVTAMGLKRREGLTMNWSRPKVQNYDSKFLLYIAVSAKTQLKRISIVFSFTVE